MKEKIVKSTTDYKWIRLWLVSVALLIIAMVIVGGLTRLTGSGLSMVEWKPILGVMPPISEKEWLTSFNMYKAFPEYQKINYNMQLAEFKKIYLWEYSHRLLGRLLGLAFAIPFFWFWMRNKLDSKLKKSLTIAFILGGGQGLLGWYMVKSGLVNVPHVSHFRLAAHLGLALFILSWLCWIWLGLFSSLSKLRVKGGSARFMAVSLMILISLQIIWGAFTAGLDAGLGYNTFPTMNGYWFPPDLMRIQPLWSNFVSNPTTVQWVHRIFGILVFLYTAIYFVKVLQDNGLKAAWSQFLLLLVVIGQVVLGILTLVNMVPLHLASMHQIGGCMVLLAGLLCCFRHFGGSEIHG